jgi:hypothetical protein
MKSIVLGSPWKGCEPMELPSSQQHPLTGFQTFPLRKGEVRCPRKKGDLKGNAFILPSSPFI